MCNCYAFRIANWVRTRINNLTNIQIIIENSNVPVIVDAGIGTPSEATLSWN
jgi:thiazole synthase ThiGH ThiG subunit